MKYIDPEREDNYQRMMDPCNPMDFLSFCLRPDWLMAAVFHWKCDIAASPRIG